MNLEEKIRYWEKITIDISKLKDLEANVKNEIKDEIMPYAVGSVILCKGSYHTNKPCKVIKYYLSKMDFTWAVKIVCQCIGDAGNELGPTDWDARRDLKLQEVVDLLNKLSPPEKSIISK